MRVMGILGLAGIILATTAGGCTERQNSCIVQFMNTPVPVQTGGNEMTVDLGGGVTMKLVRIEPGEFLMGSPEDEPNRVANEGPQHPVKITRPYYMGVYEVTQAEYLAVMGENPSHNKQSLQHPVENCTWYEANEFCRRLTRKSEWRFRLPTEAEWEYAARAGTTTAYSFGDDADRSQLAEYAWFLGNSGEQTQPVGQLKPNPWGLYDIHGNAYEWCSDWYDDKYADAGAVVDPKGNETGRLRALRSGSSYHARPASRSAYRGGYAPDRPDPEFGFRVVVVPKPQPRRPQPQE